jgi:hypothetical protein
MVSLPGFNVGWRSASDGALNWSLVWPDEQTGPQGSVYMGIPTLALAVFGLAYGKMIMRRRLVLLLLVLGGVICLSRSSPFMAMILSLPTPLRANDHFSDLVFRTGGFLFFVFGAVNGLHALLYGGWRERMAFVIFFVILLSISIGVFVTMDTAGSQIFCFYMVMSMIYLVIVIGLLNAKTFRVAYYLVGVLIGALLIDVASVNYFQVQSYWPQAVVVDDTPSDDGVGLKYMRADYYTETLISLKSLIDLERAGINLNALPFLRVFVQAHRMESLDSERKLLEAGGSFEKYNSLGLQGTNSEDADLADFFKADGTPATPKVLLSSFTRTYDQLVFGLSADQRCLLFVRDGYSPYWRVSVNGVDRKIYRALANFKCVIVPEGNSKIVFNFSPPIIPWALPLAYFAFWVTFLLFSFCLYIRPRLTSQFMPGKGREMISAA